VDITVQAGSQTLRLLAVHLHSACHEAPLARPATQPCQALAQQVPILAGWIAERRREGVAFAILGDFNRRLGPRDEMAEAFDSAAPLVRVTEGFANPCWARAGAQGIAYGRPFIDHILLGGAARDWWRRDSLRVMVYAESEPGARDMLSDHCPVSARLVLP
jgi:endonuclease/exonuclease/phosphatase family metal-dependent hydrolase